MKNIFALLLILTFSFTAFADYKYQVSGYNGDVDTGTEDVWVSGGAYAFPATAAASNVISSSANDAAAGTGARTIRVTGLDANLKTISEVATLNGTTLVALTGLYLRINMIEVLTAGSGGVNAGTIDARQSSTVYSRILAGDNRARTAVFTVPANGINNALLKNLACSSNNAVSGAVVCRVWTRKSGGLFQNRLEVAVHGANNNFGNYVFAAPLALSPGEDVRIEATSTADNTIVTVNADIVASSAPLF